MKPYTRFVAMVATSTVAMYGLTYLNTHQLSHVRFSEMRVYMALIMGSVMAVIMLAFMQHMLTDRRSNMVILASCAAILGIAVYLVRSQTMVDDVSYMRARIPHHSIAILTSERANISDPRVRQLADEIIPRATC